ncbi:MAG: ApaG domain, partial [Burkholderiales bacterium]
GNDCYVWSYTIYIKNLNDRTVQLMNKHWQVIDSLGRIENIIGPGIVGPGVIGQQPVILPGEVYEATREIHLTTPSGIVKGRVLVHLLGIQEAFSVAIPTFSLDSPYQARQLQ